ncbi:hypothetical protein D3C86_1866110 [compost metagenome]
MRLATGSWKIIEISLPMIFLRSADDMPSRSRPLNVNLSAVTFAVHGRRPMAASIDTDLPEPDSPTIASTSFS